jgi:hypothetical protein
LAPAATATVPLPLPLAPLVTVSQLGSLLVAVHEHQLGVVTLKLVASPLAASDAEAGDSENEQPAAAWMTLPV